MDTVNKFYCLTLTILPNMCVFPYFLPNWLEIAAIIRALQFTKEFETNFCYISWTATADRCSFGS